MTVAAELALEGPHAGRILIASEFRDKELVKQLPGVQWDKDFLPSGIWHGPLSYASAYALKGVFGDRLQVGPYLKAWVAQEFARRVQPCMNLRFLEDAPGWGPEGLRPDQRVGVAMLWTGRSVLLGDDMGGGKTVMGSCALDLAMKTPLHLVENDTGFGSRPPAPPGAEVVGDLGPALVVCPNGVKRGWERELAKWAPDLKPVVIRGSKLQRLKAIEKLRSGEANVGIVNWENLRNHSRLAPYGSVRLKSCSACDANSDVKPTSCERCERDLNTIRFSVIIADEVHRAKDPKSKWTRALWAIAHKSMPYFAWGLTGTLIADAMDDWWSVGHFMAPDEYPSKTRYVERYGLQSWNAFGGMQIVGIRPDTRDEFFAFFDPRFLRRPREYQLRHLHEPVVIDRIVEMSPKQAKLYRELAEEMIGRLDNGDTLLATNPLTQTARLNQAAASFLRKDDCERCGATGLKPGTRVEEGEKCTACNGHAFVFSPEKPSSKIDDLLEFLNELPPHENVVVFAVSRKLLELTQEVLDDKGISNCIISGKVSEAQRYVNVDAFGRGEKRVCLVVIDAGGEGIDGLQAGGRTVYFMQRHYAAWKNKQAIGRLLRSGQEGQVVVVNARAEGTIEDDKEVVIAEKEDRFEELVRDREFLRRMLERSTTASK